MQNPVNEENEKKSSLSRPNRRDFLKISAFGAMAAASTPAIAERVLKMDPLKGGQGRSNTDPGRIVLLHDANMLGHQATIDKDVVEGNVHLGIRTLTGIDDTGAAFESLFPGLTATSTFAIKVNCIGPTDSRWETVRGVVSGLSLMLGGTYDVSQVIVYDPHNLGYHGYTAAEFTFNGKTAVLSNTHNAGGSGYYVYGSHELSRYILDSDFVINVPALKSHSNGNNQITVALKNHYGSCQSQSLCGNIPGMLTVNSDPNVKDKTGLVVTCALRGTYNGGPGESPQVWNTFPEQSPNMLFLTTDPVTNEYWAREYINAERTARGWSTKPCTWVELASGAPYNIGVSDPALMTVLSFEPSDVGVEENTGASALFLAPNMPNPFTESTVLRFSLPRSGRAAITVVDVSGRVVRRLGERNYPGGFNDVEWDGRDSRGRRTAAGVYLIRLQVGSEARTRRIVKVR